jgi:hypothetical protein
MEQTFRNNLIIVTTGSAWRWRINLGSDAWDTNSTFENNIVYKLSSTTNVLTRESCDIVSGCAGGAVTNYAFPQFQSTYKATNNANTNPLVVRANPTEYGSAGLFDFRLQPGSPARDFGTTAGAPADDLTKAPRILPPDAGAYEYGGSTMSPPQAPTNLRIVR